MRGGAHEVGHRNRIVVQAGRDQARIMGHVHEQLGTAVLRDLGKLGVGNLPRVGAGAGHDHFRVVLAGKRSDLVEVDAMVVGSHAVADEMIEAAGNVEPHAVGQMPAMGQVESQHDVARLQRGHVDRRVGLRAGVRLDVDVIGPEELLRRSRARFSTTSTNWQPP